VRAQVTDIEGTVSRNTISSALHVARKGPCCIEVRVSSPSGYIASPYSTSPSSTDNVQLLLVGRTQVPDAVLLPAPANNAAPAPSERPQGHLTFKRIQVFLRSLMWSSVRVEPKVSPGRFEMRTLGGVGDKVG